MHTGILRSAWRQRGEILAASFSVAVLVACGPMPSPVNSPSARVSSGVEGWTTAMTGCLRDAGWDVVADPAGDGFSVNGLSGEQRPAYIAAEGKCEQQVGPPPPAVPLDEAQIRERYGFLLDARECLIGLGYSISEPPSEEAFLESWATGPWSPYNDVVDSVSSEQWEEINAACPQSQTSTIADHSPLARVIR